MDAHQREASSEARQDETRLKDLRYRLYGIYTFFDQLLVTEHYYRLALVPSRQAGQLWKAGAAILSAAGASAVFPGLSRELALLAVLGAGAPYLKDLMGFSEKKVSHLEGLWKSTRALRAMMQREVIDRISSERVEIEKEGRVPPQLLETVESIRSAEAELAKDAPTFSRDDSLRKRATAAARQRFPPKGWWYP